MTSTKLRKNDTVQVLAGKDRGRQGRVLRVISKSGRAVVEQINMVKRHERPNPQKNIKGGILEKEAPIALSSLGIVCGECKRPTRIRTRREKGERKSTVARLCTRCGSELGR